MYTPVNPSFAIKKWGLKGSKLYRWVFVMVYGYAGAIYNENSIPLPLSILNGVGPELLIERSSSK